MTADPLIHSAFDSHDWEGVVRAAREPGTRSAEDEFEYGMASAHLQHWTDARAALLAGRGLCPTDKRFPIELAGIAFQQKRYPEAATWIRRGLRLDDRDSYALDFAGTTYYLMGNLPAALKYWNRVQKPYIAGLQVDPNLHVGRLLLERAFAFAPAQVMTGAQFAATRARLDGLGIFPAYNIGIHARTDGKFDAEFYGMERDRWGGGRWQALISIFSGAPYETIYPSYYNIGGRAMNADSVLRWDAQKRRLWVSLTAPLRGLPQWRWQVATDERDENWDVRRSFTGTAPVLGALHLRREVVGGSVTAFQGGRLQWCIGGELSNRTFSHLAQGSALTRTLASSGWQAKNVNTFSYTLVDVPERRLAVTVGAVSELARLWSSPAQLYEKLQGSERLRWYPQATGDKYEVEQRVRAGKTFGKAPFDELWILGVERDNDLWLRGDIGTRDGRKGSAPLGDRYFLSNNDFYRRVYDNGLFGVKIGPLLDVGRMGAPTSGLAPRQWLVSAGAEAKLTVLGTSIVLTYGRDLRAGTNAFFATVAK